MRSPRLRPSPLALAAVLLGGCRGPAAPAPARVEAAPVRHAHVERPDLPLAGVTAEQLARFREGDRVFELPFREADGLGPLYIRASCEACHQADGRGPGLVPKMAIVERDGVTPARDQSRLAFGATERPYATAGARRALLPPDGVASVRETFRLPPAVFGRGYLEAIDPAELLRLEAQNRARPDGIRGRVSRVSYDSERNPDARVHAHEPREANLVGRFGLKARIATLDEFAADALQGDMGLTSPVRPREPANPEGIADDRKPGVDVPLDAVNALADYLRLIDIPPRAPSPSDTGRAAFAEALCAACHVPVLETARDYPVPQLAGIDAPVYTDLLLHDMGTDLADGVVDMGAGSREWRTAPLIGLRYAPALLHDGRAHGVEEAVLAHEGPGSEANASIAKFRALPATVRTALVAFVEGL